MKRISVKWIALIGVVGLAALLLVALLAGTALAQGPGGWQRGPGWGPGMMGGRGGMMGGYGFSPTEGITGTVPFGYGPGMMRGYRFGPTEGITGTVPFGYGPGMMGGWRGRGMMGGRGGMMGRGMMGGWGFGPTAGITGTVPFGHGPGMMGWWGDTQPTGERLTLDQAAEAVDQYLAAYGNSDLATTEIMEFSSNFYAEVAETSTGVHAFELLVDPYTGAIHPEPGPNMMWNTKYGHMGAWWGDGSQAPATEMAVGADKARELAQDYLDAYLPGANAGDEAEAFYGYYTLHVLKDGQVTGMLSVNGTTGQVWYHNWHGDFIGMSEE